MQENQISDIRDFNTDIVGNIEYLFNVTTWCSTELNLKITMKTPGRTYTKLRDFKFNFNYLFELSSKRKELDEKISQQARAWLNMDVQYGIDGDVKKDYLMAGLTLFERYGNELYKKGMLKYKK